MIDRIQQTQALLGGVADPHAAWLLLRGVKTLGLRVQRASDTAYDLARFLDSAEVDALRLIPIATILGGVESVIEIPADLDFSEDEPGDAAEATGVRPGLIRLSVGIEDEPDLREDLELGLTALRRLTSEVEGAAAI